MAKHGGARRGAKVQGRDSTLNRDTSYLAARLRRDHPDAVFDEAVRGSVRKAAIEAGIVKVPSGLDRLRRAWDRATEDEREEFCRAVGLR